MILFAPKKGFGLDISDASIEALELEKVSKEIKVKSYGRIEIPEKKLIEDGLIKNKEALVKSIKEVLEKTEPEKIKTRYVLLSLPESKVLTHIFELPINLTLDQIKEVLSYEIESIFPYPANELSIDFKVVSKKDKTQEIFLAGIPKKIVNDYKEVLEKSGLIPLVFDMESKSLARALIEKIEKNKAVIILDIGARTSIISVFDEVGLRFTTNLKIAGNLFTQKISQNLNLLFDEAEKLKIKEGFSSEKFGQILKNEAKPICQEIKKVIEYTERKYNFKIEKIILAGGSSLLPKIEEYFQLETGLLTERGNPLTKLSKDNILSKKEKNILFANVIGLALRALEKDPIKVDINLLQS